MNIPLRNYSLDSFLDYIVNNVDDIFGEDHQRKWLKVHLVYTISQWKDLFRGVSLEDYGEITRIIFEDSDLSKKSIIEFYAYEWKPGLVMFLTSAIEKEYEGTLKQFINSHRGITESWIKPSVFEELKNTMLTKHEARLYRFIGRRYMHWKVPSQIRPDYDRRISYSGEDAAETLKEYQTLYGILPSSIDLRVYGSKMQVNRNGLFVIRRINRKSIGVLQEIIDTVVVKQYRLKETSEKLNAKTKTLAVSKGEVKVPTIVAGKITLPNAHLSELIVKNMFGQVDTYEIGKFDIESDDEESDFSFIDTFVKEEPLTFSATVVDEVKGTIFGISGSDNVITLIPKHRITFETFVNFYNLIMEYFDESANLTTFSEEIVA